MKSPRDDGFGNWAEETTPPILKSAELETLIWSGTVVSIVPPKERFSSLEHPIVNNPIERAIMPTGNLFHLFMIIQI